MMSSNLSDIELAFYIYLNSVSTTPAFDIILFGNGNKFKPEIVNLTIILRRIWRQNS